MDPVALISWIVVFVVVTVTVSGLSGRAGVSAPVALVLVGGVASFIPAVPTVEIEPDLILYGLLPPLLFASAIRISFIDIRARNDGIILLSVGAVAFTVVSVGFASWLLIPSITLAAAFAFAAVIAPTDAVAVSAIAGRLGLPRRVLTILEGESLLNDATALVALNASILAITSVVNPVMIAGEFVIEVVAGVGVGLAVGWVLSQVRRRLRAPVLDTCLSLITPFLAFLLAQSIHGSGVLAVVSAGLLLGYRAPIVQSAEARIAESLNWRTIQFLLENAVFLFIGLNLAGILEGAIQTGPGLWPTVFISVGVLAALIVSRFVWEMAVTAIYRLGPRRLRERSWSWGNGIAVSAAGVRGVVTLAAVFLLPEDTPSREFLQFLAFVVVVGTLLSGLALPAIIRALHLPPPNHSQERVEQLMLMAEVQTAGLSRLDELTTEDDEEQVLTRLRTNASFVANALEQYTGEGSELRTVAFARLRRQMIAAEREALLAARAEGRYQEPAVAAVLAAIDAEEATLKAMTPKPPRS
ncbi:Na+/H+ antiporter [Plantibacter sp. LMC-P-059a]|uniref:Na+/H+ antiporter n=1 Tax=Plantibacter sp. LMC-P-059a TaxID=3040297 RepID=UPI0025514ED2|nr:Na+/H+ antiporter [Plantibacter sp. LMC-P-059a]